MAGSDFVRIFLFIIAIVLFYQCIRKGRRHASQRLSGYPNPDAAREEDLRRFRERMSERGNAHTGNSASAIAARKELVEKNLFSRQIRREESVRELHQLLAISRGGEVDEELGGCVAVPTQSSGDGLGKGARKPEVGASNSESSLPAPSAPPQSVRSINDDMTPTVEAVPESTLEGGLEEVALEPAPEAAVNTTLDTIATAISSQHGQGPSSETTPAQTPAANPITFEPIRNLWNNLTQPLHSERSERDMNASTHDAGTTSGSIRGHKLECSICLEHYVPGDTIAWAKDGGDPPTPSSATVGVNSDNMGCDHIFHKGCISAWLEDHEECPLCRRTVVHADADRRYAGWSSTLSA